MEQDKKKSSDYQVGDKAMFEETVTRELISEFGRLSKDQNPIHVNADYASRTPLRAPIAHGMIAGMMFSRLIGMHMPGPGALYLSQKMGFHRPMYAGTDVVISGSITQKVDALGIMTMHTTIHEKKTNVLLVDGEAVVKIL